VAHLFLAPFTTELFNWIHRSYYCQTQQVLLLRPHKLSSLAVLFLECLEGPRTHNHKCSVGIHQINLGEKAFVIICLRVQITLPLMELLGGPAVRTIYTITVFFTAFNAMYAIVSPFFQGHQSCIECANKLITWSTACPVP
jgi:hypothetical protein